MSKRKFESYEPVYRCVCPFPSHLRNSFFHEFENYLCSFGGFSVPFATPHCDVEKSGRILAKNIFRGSWKGRDRPPVLMFFEESFERFDHRWFIDFSDAGCTTVDYCIISWLKPEEMMASMTARVTCSACFSPP